MPLELELALNHMLLVVLKPLEQEPELNLEQVLISQLVPEQEQNLEPLELISLLVLEQNSQLVLNLEEKLQVLN